jgi:glycosyltransferase involved in cell wall biosynthesis
MAELRKDHPKAVLLVTGPEGSHNPANAAYKRKLLELRDGLGLHEAAHFLTEITDEKLPESVIADFYRLADALIFPSFEEGFGIPIIEAGVNSIPVFCSDIPVMRELGGKDVSYFGTQEKPDRIAKLIANRLDSSATARLSRRAKHGFTWDSIYRLKIGPLIEEVMA